MARFTHAQVANTLQLETQLLDLVGQQLINMGHKASPAGGGSAGGYQGIMMSRSGDRGSPRGADDMVEDRHGESNC
jgi:hypothetical protein